LGDYLIRQLAEEEYDYDLGPYQGSEFVEFEHSDILDNWFNNTFKDCSIAVNLSLLRSGQWHR
jgi:hypothetical protein